MNRRPWADISDDEPFDDLDIPVVVSKHGIKVMKPPDKKKDSIKTKKDAQDE